MTNENNEKSYEDILNVKEEGKVKTWFKKHKTVLAVGATSLVGVGFSIATYRLGFREGRSEGYGEGVNFMQGEYDILLKEVSDKK